MYIPKEYEWKEHNEIIDFMRRYNFATIITSANNAPRATHLPFHFIERGDDFILTAHFSKANPQWQELENVLVIFQGPHSYISPANYDESQNVPTWDYLAVHAYCEAKIIPDNDEGWQVLEDMMRQSEPAYMAQWAMLSTDYKNRLFEGIVPFELKVIRLEAKHKLDQDKTYKERRQIAETLAKSKDGAANDLAAFMMQPDSE